MEEKKEDEVKTVESGRSFANPPYYQVNRAVVNELQWTLNLLHTRDHRVPIAFINTPLNEIIIVSKPDDQNPDGPAKNVAEMIVDLPNAQGTESFNSMKDALFGKAK